jgi:hypothetical protein
LRRERDDGEEAAPVSRIQRYQKTHGSVDVTLETAAAIDREVDIEKGLAETDVQLAELREKFTDSHPVVATLKQKTAQMARGEARRAAEEPPDRRARLGAGESVVSRGTSRAAPTTACAGS